MLYKIDYTARSKRTGDETFESRWITNAANQSAAVTRFMDWFFADSHDMQVRLEQCTEIEIIGDMSGIEAIDAAVSLGAQ